MPRKTRFYGAPGCRGARFNEAAARCRGKQVVREPVERLGDPLQ